MGYSPDLGFRGYRETSGGVRPSGRRPLRDTEEEKRQEKIEAIYATRPRTLVRALRMRDSGLLREVIDEEASIGEGHRIKFDPEKDILGAGDFAITYKTKWADGEAVLKILLPVVNVWDVISENQSGRGEALQAIADDEWEILKMQVPGVVSGLASGEVALTSSTTIPFILRAYHPHTVNSTAHEIKAHPERIPIILQAAKQLGKTLDLLRANHGVVVSDITPDNVFVDENRNFLVGDAGGALRVRGDRPALFRGFSFGTPHMMFAPPEFNKSMAIPGREVVTPQAQVYSLAALLHLMAGGIPPDRLDRFLGNEHMDTDKLGLPYGMVEALRKALSREPQDRFDTPGEFAEALQASV